MAEQKQEKEQVAAPKKKSSKKNVPYGRCYIQAGFGNTIVTFTDGVGNTISWSSAGAHGFKGSRKGTPFAAQVTSEDASKKALENGVRSVDGRGHVALRQGRSSGKGPLAYPGDEKMIDPDLVTLQLHTLKVGGEPNIPAISLHIPSSLRKADMVVQE